MSAGEVLIGDVNNVIAKRLSDVKQREMLVKMLMAGFEQVRKKNVPDLPARLKLIETRALKLAENVSVSFLNGRLMLKVAGSSEMLLNEFRRGTDWYAPWEDVDDLLLAAAMTDPER